MLRVGFRILDLLLASALAAPLFCNADPAVERGFHHTGDGRDLVEKAVATVYFLVGDQSQALRPAWLGQGPLTCQCKTG